MYIEICRLTRFRRMWKAVISGTCSNKKISNKNNIQFHNVTIERRLILYLVIYWELHCYNTAV